MIKLRLTSQLATFLKIDPELINKQHLRLLEMQPAGEVAPNMLIFPLTKDHFDLLRSLDPNKSRINGLKLHYKYKSEPMSFGVELFF